MVTGLISSVSSAQVHGEGDEILFDRVVDLREAHHRNAYHRASANAAMCFRRRYTPFLKNTCAS